MAGKKYFLIVAIPVFLLVLTLLGLSFYLQPFTGDLTRIGGYTENDFGWNEPQFGYSDVGTLYGGSGKQPVGSDYVVYGDSFSYWCSDHGSKSALSACFQWTAFFKKQTGLQGLTYHQDHYSPEEFIQRIKGSAEKPKFVIYQSVERYAVPRLMKVAEGEGCVISTPLAIDQLSFNQTSESLMSVDRLQSLEPFDMNIPSAYLKQFIVSLRKPRVLKESLTAGLTLFSNNDKNELLYHREDLNKTRYTSEHYEVAKCGMNVFAARIQRELGLPTFFLIAPDKSSVYGEWFENKQNRVNSFLPEIGSEEVNFVNLLAPMVAAAEQGVVDIYLPNDTHWGARGGELAASVLAGAIKK